MFTNTLYFGHVDASSPMFVLPSTEPLKPDDMIWYNHQICHVNGTSHDKRPGGKTTLYITYHSNNHANHITLEQACIPNTKIYLRVVKLESSKPIEPKNKKDWGPNIAAAIFMMQWVSPFIVPLEIIPENSFFGLGQYLQFLRTFKCERLSKHFLNSDGSIDLDKIFNYGRAGNNYDPDQQRVLIKQLIGGLEC